MAVNFFHPPTLCILLTVIVELGVPKREYL
jgi:hypothetical protein